LTTQASPELRPEPRVSIVVPVYNEEDVLPLLLPRLRTLLDGLAPGSEVCFVNDGSHDGSLRLLEVAAAQDPRLKIIDFSRNFGHPAAITAGLDHARGDAVVLMDADLQDPPELVGEMVALYRRGYDVVHARRKGRRDESLFKKISAWLFYRLIRLVGHREMPANVGEFGLMSRDVVTALRGLRERHRLVRGLVAWVGFRQTNLDFERPGRAAGITKYPLSKMLLLSWDAITSFSAVPLRLATLLGLLALFVGLGYAAYATYVGYVLGLGVPGWTSLVIINIFFSGVVLICLGLVGEYVGRIFEEVKGRPLYVVRRTTGLESERRPGDGALVSSSTPASTADLVGARLSGRSDSGW
jgi:dolichol-phosphate mannosyltransferase